MAAGRILLVIPAWNEAHRLPVEQFAAHASDPAGADLLFVNDGSTDGTAAVLGDLAAGTPDRIRVLALPTNRGKGEAVRAGLLEACRLGYPVAGYLDADLAAPLDSVVPLAAALEAHPAVLLAIGSRVKLLGWSIRRSELRHYLGRVFATFASITLALPVYDTQCGAKLLRLEPRIAALLERPFTSRWLFDVELIARIRDAAGAAAMREVPLPVWEDRGGSSLRLRDFARAPFELLAIRRRYPPTAR